MSDKLPPVFDDLLTHLQEEGGQIVIGYHIDRTHGREWVVGYTFGKEEPENPDNDMAGGAAYGVGPDLDSAVLMVTEQVGL
jgi:hypothetical protein